MPNLKVNSKTTALEFKRKHNNLVDEVGNVESEIPTDDEIETMITNALSNVKSFDGDINVTIGPKYYIASSDIPNKDGLYRLIANNNIYGFVYLRRTDRNYFVGFYGNSQIVKGYSLSGADFVISEHEYTGELYRHEITLDVTFTDSSTASVKCVFDCTRRNPFSSLSDIAEQLKLPINAMSSKVIGTWYYNNPSKQLFGFAQINAYTSYSLALGIVITNDTSISATGTFNSDTCYAI